MNRLSLTLAATVSLTLVATFTSGQAQETAGWYLLSDPVDNCVVANHPAKDVYKLQIAGPFETQMDASAALRNSTICEESPDIDAEDADDEDRH